MVGAGPGAAGQSALQRTGAEHRVGGLQSPYYSGRCLSFLGEKQPGRLSSLKGSLESRGQRNGKQTLQQNRANPKPSPQSWDELITVLRSLEFMSCLSWSSSRPPPRFLASVRRIAFQDGLEVCARQGKRLGERWGEREKGFLTLLSWSLLGFMLLVFREMFRS